MPLNLNWRCAQLRVMEEKTSAILQKVTAEDFLPSGSFSKLSQEHNLGKNSSRLVFDERIRLAKKYGFFEICFSDLLKDIEGETPTDEWLDKKEALEYGWNHHTNEELPTTWSGEASYFVCDEYNPKTILDVVLRKRCQNRLYEYKRGKLGSLQVAYPVEVLERLTIVKKLKLFNAYEVFAPVSCWEDPHAAGVCILAGQIWLLPPDVEGKFSGSEEEEHFFVTSWKAG